MVAGPAVVDADHSRAKRLPNARRRPPPRRWSRGVPLLPPRASAGTWSIASGRFRDQHGARRRGDVLPQAVDPPPAWAPRSRRSSPPSHATGLPLDHVNAHKHFHLHPTIAGLILNIGRRYGLAAARAPVEPVDLLARIEPVPRTFAGRIAAPYARSVARRFRLAGLTVPDRVLGLAWSGHMTTERVAGLIANLPPGLTELYCHPATEDVYPGSAPGYAYRGEFAALLDPSIKARIGQRDIHLTRFGDVSAKKVAA